MYGAGHDLPESVRELHRLSLHHRVLPSRSSERTLFSPGVAWSSTPKCNRPQLAVVWSVIEPRINRISQSDQGFMHVFALFTLLIGETFVLPLT